MYSCNTPLYVYVLWWCTLVVQSCLCTLSAQTSGEKKNDLLHNEVHCVVSFVEQLIQKREFRGNADVFFSLIESCVISRPVSYDFVRTVTVAACIVTVCLRTCWPVGAVSAAAGGAQGQTDQHAGRLLASAAAADHGPLLQVNISSHRHTHSS